VDFQANGGGYILLGYDFFRQLFPQVVQDGFSRWKENAGFNAMSRIISDKVEGLNPYTSDDADLIQAWCVTWIIICLLCSALRTDASVSTRDQVLYPILPASTAARSSSSRPTVVYIGPRLLAKEPRPGAKWPNLDAGNTVPVVSSTVSLSLSLLARYASFDPTNGSY
jgi:hypothetical protein